MTMTHETPENARDCPGCGMPREDWPDNDPGGYATDSGVFCCRGCAEGSGCTCAVSAGASAPTQAELREDPASGSFVRSLQHETRTIEPGHYGTPVTKQPTSRPDPGPA
jgi:hypothetical protein